MADITIEGSTHDTLNTKQQPRSLVWTSPSVGYIFFVENTFDLHYRKTTNSGASWGSAVTIRQGTVQKFSVWYDKWTKGDTGAIIHIIFTDTDDDDMTYNSLDTSDDTLGGEVIAFAGSSTTSSNWGDGCLSIVKARGGNILAGGWIDSSGENDLVRATDSPATSFTSRATVADGSSVDRIQFLAGNETDSNDIWCMYQDASANTLTLKVYDDSGDSWSESGSIDTIAENSSFFGFDSMDRHSDGHAIVIMWNAHLSATGDLAVWDITDINTQTAKADVITNDSAYGVVGILINQQNDNIYAAYTTASTSGSIKYKLSSDGAGTWGSATDMSVTSDDHRMINGGTSVQGEGGRWMPVWFNDDLNDLVTNADNSVEIKALTHDAAMFGCNF